MSEQPDVQELLAAAQRMSERVRVLREALLDLFGVGMERMLMGDGKDDQIEAIAKARAALKATQ